MYCIPCSPDESQGYPVRVDRGLPLLAGVVLRLVPPLLRIAGVGGLGFRVVVTP
jgi:hypothetical protein